jgi:creatinine amidohydrolase
VLAVPLGSCEQHGPHLPLATDSIIAEALAMELAAARPGVLVAPGLAVGASGEHQGFPGTLSIGTAALTAVLVELVRSADWVGGVVFINGHGGNAEAVAAATGQLHHEHRDVLSWWPPTPSDRRADAHAGWTETAVLLHLAPNLVEREVARAGVTTSLDQLLTELRRHGVAAVSPNGVLGDPTGADAASGATIMQAWVSDLVTRFDRWVR